MKFKIFEKDNIFTWIEPKGVTKLRDLIQYGKDPFWEKLTYKKICGYAVLFLLLFFIYYDNHFEEATSAPRLIISALFITLTVILIISLFWYIASLVFDKAVIIKQNSIRFQNGSDTKEIKFEKISDIILLSGCYQNRYYNVLVFKQKHKILQVTFISDIIKIEYLMEFLSRIGKYVTQYNLITYLKKREVSVLDCNQREYVSGRHYIYPKDNQFGSLGMGFISLIMTVFVIYTGLQDTFEPKIEIYFWYAAILIMVLLFLSCLLFYNKYSQEIFIENPFVIQNFKLWRKKNFYLLDNLSFKMDSGGELKISNKNQKISVNTKLIHFADFCKEIDQISNLNIIKTIHKDQYKNYTNGMANLS
ncbi:hypothetical protein JW835_10515 [bacterium]|nr:hypothetical protein [bacterium]